MSAIADRLVMRGYRAGWFVARVLPERTAHRVARGIGDRSYARNGLSVRRLRANYARVRPELGAGELEDLVHAGMRSHVRYWCDAFRLPTMDNDAIAARVRVEGDAAPRAQLAAGRPVVAFLGHIGNWDIAGAWATFAMKPVTTVAERLKPEELFRDFLAFRESLGMTIFPLTSGEDVFAKLVDATEGPVIVPLLADRDLTRRGVVVQLCGHEASAAAGPAALTLRTGAALFPVSITYEPCAELPSGWRTVITFHDRVAEPEVGTQEERVAAMTQACVDALGRTIATHTEDWHMFQKVFLDPGERPSGASAGSAQ